MFYKCEGFIGERSHFIQGSRNRINYPNVSDSDLRFQIVRSFLLAQSFAC